MMKKSKIVGIGLLALSIASCRTTHKERERLEDQNPNYYIDNGAGYNRGGVSPIWIYYMMGYNNGRTISYPTYVHKSYGRNGTYHATNFGSRSKITSKGIISKNSVSHVTRNSVSRGGFGHSTASHSSSGGRSSAS